MGKKSVKKVKSIFYFLVIIAVVVIVLKVINWLPMAIQQDTLRRYDNIDEVRSKLKIKDIYVPSYFPQNLQWPPSEILAQGAPYQAVMMKFSHKDSGDTALIISQSAGKELGMDTKMRLSDIKEKVSYPVKGRATLLEVGTCSDGTTCSSISWEEGKYRMHIAIRSKPFNLVKIAESMLP